MLSTKPIITTYAIEQAIETLQTPFSFGSSAHIEANRLIASMEAVVCGNCEDDGWVTDSRTKERAECKRCHGKHRGYRKGAIFWTGWAPQTTKGNLI